MRCWKWLQSRSSQRGEILDMAESKVFEIAKNAQAKMKAQKYWICSGENDWSPRNTSKSKQRPSTGVSTGYTDFG